MISDDYETFIAKSRYARWIEAESRRETWEESVDRLVAFWVDHVEGMSLDTNDKAYVQNTIVEELGPAIKKKEIMPSMRSLMTAGKALKNDNIAGYNCSFLPIDHPRAFDECMYILMCGTGVGFSVERKFVEKLPIVSEDFHDTNTPVTVADSRLGWATAFRELIALLYSGRTPRWDLSKLRPKGARLKTFGGRSSGPEPLADLFQYTVGIFKGAAGRRLSTVECHDLVCKIAEVVVVGGVRRSALISLSNLTDERMAHAKTGAWYETEIQRSLANNSVAYTEKPDPSIFLKEWRNLYDSKSGERGLFNRTTAASKRLRSLEAKGLSTSKLDYNTEPFGTNPCGEIILPRNGVCNLSEVVIRSGDDFQEVSRKVRLASILGTLQSSLTNFRYLRSIWRDNTEEQRLLGVSFTGIMDHPIMSRTSQDGRLWGKWNLDAGVSVDIKSGRLDLILESLKKVAVDTNTEWASVLGIGASHAVTCVKPSGTVSQLVGSSSGIHPSYSKYYIRTVRQDVKDPLTKFLLDQGVPAEVDVTNPQNMVFSWPMKAPEKAVTDTDAMKQLELYKVYNNHWCDHNPSITVYYNDDNFMDCGNWIYNNWDSFVGVSFLPKTDHVYKQAPYQPLTEEEYDELVVKFPEIDWSKFDDYEKEDNTTASQELACVGGVCEI